MTIKKIAAYALLTGATAIFSINSATAQSADAASPLPGTRLAGQGLLRCWGMEIYRARLWLHPEFQPTQYAAHPLALELTYLHNFSAQDIAQRSISVNISEGEMMVRRIEEEARGRNAFTPRSRKRVVSKALRQYAHFVSSADQGAVRLID